MKVHVRLTPKASRNHLEVVLQDADMVHLRAWVTAIPEDNKANDALVKLLAKHFAVAKSRLTFVSGQTSRDKVFIISC